MGHGARKWTGKSGTVYCSGAIWYDIVSQLCVFYGVVLVVDRAACDATKLVKRVTRKTHVARDSSIPRRHRERERERERERRTLR